MKPNNITARNAISLKKEKREFYGAVPPHDSLFCFIAGFAYVTQIR